MHNIECLFRNNDVAFVDCIRLLNLH